MPSDTEALEPANKYTKTSGNGDCTIPPRGPQAAAVAGSADPLVPMGT